MPERFANAADCVPEPCWIAGTQMRPFCLGHHLLFRRLGLPFAGSHGADCGPADVLMGVLICAQPYETTLGQMNDDTWEEVQREWLKAITKRKTDLADAELRFRKYLATGYTHPPIHSHAGAMGIQMTAPWEELLKVRLIMSGFSESEVLNGYLPCRWYDYFTALELSASERCEDKKHWRPMFYTRAEAEQIAVAKEAMRHGK